MYYDCVLFFINGSMKKTKIIATLWPATANRENLIKLYQSGVNIIRFNFSHANYQDATKNITLIKWLNSEGLTQFSLLLDTKGPEIRTGVLEGGNISYQEGDFFRIYTDMNKIQGAKSLFCDYPFLVEDVAVGKEIVIDSGLLNTKVISKTDDFIEVQALNNALIGSRRHINLPWVRLKLPWITQQDERDIAFALEHEFDFIAASFIRSKAGILKIQEIFKKYNNPYIKIISKIENQEAIDNLDEIIEYTDGIMVARGDLWVEVPIEKLSVYQRQMIEKSKNLGKFVVIATHLLETMIENPFPTRAETSDIFHSVLQQTDCLMLSWETAIGKYPIDAVKIMTKTIQEAENYFKAPLLTFSDDNLSVRDIEKKYLIKAWFTLCEELSINTMIILTKTWKLARLASAFKSNHKVLAFTKEPQAQRVMQVYYGVTPVLLPTWSSENYMQTMDDAIKLALDGGYIKVDEKVVVINDIQRDGKEIPIMEILTIKDFLKK